VTAPAVRTGRERAARRVVVASLWLLAVAQGVTGAWALVAPQAFYDGFPVAGHAVVALLPPYNEHLVRDVGGLFLAVAVVLATAAVRADRASARLAAASGLVMAVPHTVFHALHLEHFPMVDAVAQTVGTVLHVVLLATVFVLSTRLD